MFECAKACSAEVSCFCLLALHYNINFSGNDSCSKTALSSLQATLLLHILTSARIISSMRVHVWLFTRWKGHTYSTWTLEFSPVMFVITHLDICPSEVQQNKFTEILCVPAAVMMMTGLSQTHTWRSFRNWNYSNCSSLTEQRASHFGDFYHLLALLHRTQIWSCLTDERQLSKICNVLLQVLVI